MVFYGLKSPILQNVRLGGRACIYYNTLLDWQDDFFCVASNGVISAMNVNVDFVFVNIFVVTYYYHNQAVGIKLHYYILKTRCGLMFSSTYVSRSLANIRWTSVTAILSFLILWFIWANFCVNRFLFISRNVWMCFQCKGTVTFNVFTVNAHVWYQLQSTRDLYSCAQYPFVIIHFSVISGMKWSHIDLQLKRPQY